MFVPPSDLRQKLFCFPIILLLLFAGLSLPAVVFAQDDAGQKQKELGAQRSTKTIEAVHIDSPPKLDGVLDDAAWESIPIATGFTTFEPEIGQAADQKTEVKLAYDNTALYVGAFMHEEGSERVLRQMGERDRFFSDNADYFAICLDPYESEQNAFCFLVTAAGVQSDALVTPNGEDGSWNAVWYSKVEISEEGWVLELKIPYSALRFPQKDVQNWGIGLERSIRRTREKSTWYDFDPRLDGAVNQFGTLKGLENIAPPLRLSITPYVSAYAEYYNDWEDPDANHEKYFIRGGMDLKYGINESFTLDMTLIPDFGQVQSDDQLLNLSPFEIQFAELRPFFLEGVDLFQRADLFYSRRIGGQPYDFYGVYDLDSTHTIINNPGETQLYNASKVSGRTDNGMGIGVFNAVTAEMRANLEVDGESMSYQTAPLTNYNIWVLDQPLKNSSYVSLINTNVMRRGHFRDANVTGVEFKIANKKQSYAIGGNAAISQLHSDEPTVLGHKHNIRFGKINGNFRWRFFNSLVSDNYNQNDLGFQTFTNFINYGWSGNYNIFQPKGIMNSVWTNFGFEVETRYRPVIYQYNNVFASGGITFKNFLSAWAYTNHNLANGKDYFEPRLFDGETYFTLARNHNAGFNISSDYRKPFALDFGVNGNRSFVWDMANYSVFVSPRIRVNDRLMFIHQTNYINIIKEVGFATLTDYYEPEEEDDPIFGNRKRRTVINTFTTQCGITPTMTANLRIRHYWSKVVYREFYNLADNGNMLVSDYTGNHNTSYNAFTLNLTYRWQFTPGSELSLVWKNDIYRTDADDSEWYNDINEDGYITNLSRTFQSPMTNSLSLRILWYLDYQMLKGLGKGKNQMG